MNTRSIVHDTLILFVITLIAGFLLGLVYEITLEPIAAAETEAANTTYREVFPDADSFEETEELSGLVDEASADVANWGYGSVSVDGCLAAYDASGEVLGYVINATSSEGYNGDVQISVGIDNDRQILGLGFLSISETPGLGLRARDAEFRDQFPGKDASTEISSIKNGTPDANSFQALSGASYTSGAVEDALNASIKFLNDYVLS